MAKHCWTSRPKPLGDHIRGSLSCLYQPGDAHAQEKCYHSNCLQDAHRACCSDTGIDNAHVNMMRALSVVQIVMRVESSLSDAGLVLTMTDINNMCMSILKENNVENLTQSENVSEETVE